MNRRITIKLPDLGATTDVADRQELISWLMNDAMLRRILEKGEWVIELREKKEDEK